jgi:hypothetical protein
VDVRSLGFAFSLLAVCLGMSACTRVESSDPTPKPAPSPAPAPSAPPPATAPAGAATTRNADTPLVLARGVRFLKAGPGDDVAKLVRDEREKVRADGRDLIVYVGATWCEPCQYFHRAALHGDLDGEFPDLSILEFDLDDDRERLLGAGYESKLIPLFVYPGPDGHASDRRFEGSIKGNGAVSNISPRLHRLLGK